MAPARTLAAWPLPMGRRTQRLIRHDGRPRRRGRPGECLLFDIQGRLVRRIEEGMLPQGFPRQPGMAGMRGAAQCRAASTSSTSARAGSRSR